MRGGALEPPEGASGNSSDLPSVWKGPLEIRGGFVGQSEESSAVKNHSVAEKRDARKALQRELYLTLEYLMVTYPLQPEKLEQYMKQHLLEDHPAAPDDGEVEPEPAPPVEE